MKNSAVFVHHIMSPDLEEIRRLPDFELNLLVNEIEAHGWFVAKDLLATMAKRTKEVTNE